MAQKVQTVLGDVDPKVLGRVLTHEHLAMEFTHFYREPPRQLADRFTEAFTLQNIGYLRQYPYSFRKNLQLNDGKGNEAVLNDVKYYKKYGGGTIVENSTEGLKRDIGFFKAVSEQTGIHIVAGTGHYIADMQSESALTSSVESIYNHMKTELTEGCVDFPEVKAGVMGEIASVWPFRDFEKRAIRAAGELQADIDVGVSFHPHRDPSAPAEIIRVYLEAGGKAGRAVMSHLERTLCKDDQLLEFAKLGTYCQFDLFGIEVSYYQLNVETDMPSDAQRIDKIRLLLDEGLEDRILMSHDVHTKHRLADFGGHGYSHIINNVLPKMKLKGISQETIDKITIHNPATWLSMPA